jgi:hypothetical protein
MEEELIKEIAGAVLDQVRAQNEQQFKALNGQLGQLAKGIGMLMSKRQDSYHEMAQQVFVAFVRRGDPTKALNAKVLAKQAYDFADALAQEAQERKPDVAELVQTSPKPGDLEARLDEILRKRTGSGIEPPPSTKDRDPEDDEPSTD